MIERVMQQLRGEFDRSGKGRLFDELKAYMTREGQAETYREKGAALGMSEAAIKVAVHRLRRRFHDMLRGEIAQTVADDSEIDDEIRALFAAVAA